LVGSITTTIEETQQDIVAGKHGTLLEISTSMMKILMMIPKPSWKSTFYDEYFSFIIDQ
jgi:hypothetical protein